MNIVSEQTVEFLYLKKSINGETSKKQTTNLTYFVHAGVSFPQARNQEANDNEAKDQHSRHDQTQESHVARTVADV